MEKAAERGRVSDSLYKLSKQNEVEYIGIISEFRTKEAGWQRRDALKDETIEDLVKQVGRANTKTKVIGGVAGGIILAMGVILITR